MNTHADNYISIHNQMHIKFLIAKMCLNGEGIHITNKMLCDPNFKQYFITHHVFQGRRALAI